MTLSNGKRAANANPVPYDRKCHSRSVMIRLQHETGNDPETPHIEKREVVKMQQTPENDLYPPLFLAEWGK